MSSKNGKLILYESTHMSVEELQLVQLNDTNQERRQKQSSIESDVLSLGHSELGVMQDQLKLSASLLLERRLEELG